MDLFGIYHLAISPSIHQPTPYYSIPVNITMKTVYILPYRMGS